MVNYLDTGRLPSWFEGGWSPSCNSQCQSPQCCPILKCFSLTIIPPGQCPPMLVRSEMCTEKHPSLGEPVIKCQIIWSKSKLVNMLQFKKVSPARSWVSPAESWHRCRRRRSPSCCARCWSGWTSARSPTPTRLSSLSAWPAWNRSLILASFYSSGG